jgi:ABC-type Mn2+/Zn2+ transport system ATPase subunit
MSVSEAVSEHSHHHGHEPHGHVHRSPCVLDVHELVCGYGSKRIIGPISFHLHAGTFMLIEGANGVGKSTLLKTLIGLLPPLSGSFNWNLSLNELAFVPQTRTLDPMLPATVDDVLATGLHRGRGLQALRIRRDPTELARALDKVRMGGFGSHLFRELSEGQKQLVLIARALLGDPKMLLLDEPAASMDPQHEADTIDLLHEIQNERGVTILMIAHGSKLARRASDRIMTMKRNGRIHIEECVERCDRPPSQMVS